MREEIITHTNPTSNAQKNAAHGRARALEVHPVKDIFANRACDLSWGQTVASVFACGQDVELGFRKPKGRPRRVRDEHFSWSVKEGLIEGG